MVPVFLRTTGDDADAEMDELDGPASLVWVYFFVRTAGDNATFGVAEFVRSFTLVLVMVNGFLRTTGDDADAEMDELDGPAALVWVYSFVRTAGDNATLGVAEFVRSFTLVLVMVDGFLRTTGDDADAEIDELDVPAALVWVYSFLRTAGDNATFGVAEFVKSFTLVLVMVPVFLRTTGADGDVDVAELIGPVLEMDKVVGSLTILGPSEVPFGGADPDVGVGSMLSCLTRRMGILQCVFGWLPEAANFVSACADTPVILDACDFLPNTFGGVIPTLLFIENWLTGMPLVVCESFL